VDAKALQKFNDFSTNDFKIRQVFYGEDKKQYLIGETISDYHSVLYQLSDAGVFEKVELQRFEDTYEEWDNVPYVPKVIKVLENGMIAAAYPWSVIEVYSSDGQSMIGEYNCGRSCLLAAEGNVLYYADENEKEVLSINMETKEEGSPRLIEIPRSIEIKVFNSEVLEIVSGMAYICNASGIHLNVSGASLWETLIDGNQCSLDMPSETLRDFVLGAEDEYYIVLSNIGNTDVSIKHIFYDENASSQPPIVLSIFSIEDNPTIRQAITIFQKSHPDVRINFGIANTNTDNGYEVKYTYGIKNPKQTIPLKDQINVLNTELLAGKGPDILVLDGMPIESYIEKGVLWDMGSIFTPLKDNSELLPNITGAYDLDGKVYTMPLRFKLPIMSGASDAVNAANSVEELAEYAGNNNEIPLLGPSNYRALAAWLFMTYYDQTLNQENEIDEAALQDFLEAISIISVAIHASDDVKTHPLGTAYGLTIGYWTGDSVTVYKKERQTNMEELSGMTDFSLPITAVQKLQGSFRALNNMFNAYGLIGINSAGNKKELAKEFIQLLFSKEIQSLDLRDGFPVNKVAMEEWIQLDSDYYYNLSNEVETITVNYPDLKFRNEIYECICAADQPMVNDMTMMDMILDEAEQYLRGDITSEQAASNIVSSINLYLSE
jgi:ABC-type glycerol-3-phosphate transport system substrate-binding protein